MSRRGPPNPADLAAFAQLRHRVEEMLCGDGVSAGWLSERTGVGLMQCTHWLKELGATRHGAWFRIPQRSRLANAGGELHVSL